MFVNESHIQNVVELRESIPVVGHYDIIVVGGGIAGIAAAIAGARKGKNVLLIEKSVMLGGLATLGLIVYFLPLCDGRGRKLIGGIAEEMLWASIGHSYGSLPDAWRKNSNPHEGHQRFQTVFNGPLLAMRLDRMILDSGAHVQFDTLFCDVAMKGNRVTHVIAQNLNGRIAYECDAVIDASGDAGVFQKAGSQTVLGNNFMTYWGYYTDLKSIRRAAETESVQEAVKIFTGGADCTGNGQPSGIPTMHGISAEDVNTMVLAGRSEALDYIERQPPESIAFTGLPGMPQFRTTRMIAGDYALEYKDCHKHFDDSIASCGDWRKADMPFEIPYRTLTSPGVENVLAAGRIISCGDTEAWEVTRVIPVAAQTGEAAGIAAVLAGKNDVHRVDAGFVAEEMKKAGHVIHI